MSKFHHVGQCYYWQDGNESYRVHYLRVFSVCAYTPDGPGVSFLKIDFSRENGSDFCNVLTGTLEISTFASKISEAEPLKSEQFEEAFRDAMGILNYYSEKK